MFQCNFSGQKLMTQSIYKEYINTGCNFDVKCMKIFIEVRMYIHTLKVSMN